ncbi:MAG: hypothetical protein Q7U91_03500 [Sideroxyarcus sp.]|nr:hypothetical protein [Sideroxyarcus sp.]
MMLRAALFAAFAGLWFSSTAFAVQCSGSGPRPDWVDSPESVTEEHLFAAGVSDDPQAPLAERIATAKQNALKNLSEMIEVSVKNSLVLEQSSRNVAGTELTDSSLQSITKTSTNASLRNVESVATWEDPKTCSIWLRARVSKKHVEQGKREGLAKTLFGVLNEQLAVVQNEGASLNGRLSAVDAALEVLPRIALEFIPEASSAEHYARLLNGFKRDLQQTRDDLDQAKAALAAADLQVNQASGQTGEVEKSRTLVAAAGAYKGLLAKHGGGLPPVFEPGDILFKLGEVEELRKSACGAKSYFQQAADSKQLNDRREIARKKAETLVCSAEEMEKTLWRQYFEGRATTLVCYFNSGTDRGAWNKACDSLNNVIRPLGADVEVRMQALSAPQLQALQKGEIPKSMGEPGKLVLGVVALGKMRNRADRDPQGRGREYQFEGGMTTFLLENGTPVFADRFQGTTGWNPISQEMVMDVLGINVIKRWREKFSRFLRHELN